MFLPLIWLSKLILFLSRALSLGAGSTWPGHIALIVQPTILHKFASQFPGKIILIAGTNGKTTTAKMIRTVLEHEGKKVIHNESGANLLNGIASSFIQSSNMVGGLSQDYAIFEVDENTLPMAIEELKPHIVVLLNLFRDQLDRYGEVDAVASKWDKALRITKRNSVIILNADDPSIAYLGKNIDRKLIYFGIENKKLFIKTPQHAMDVIYCPNCGKRLIFSGIYFSHLGIWRCESCGMSRPKPDPSSIPSPLPGIYNEYNTKAAMLVLKVLGVNMHTAKQALTLFTPAFGRQEEFIVDDRKVKIFLSKNPAGFNESIRTVKFLGAKAILLVLNDRIPDGRDVSWIWDVDFEEINDTTDSIIVSGDRVYDMALRIKYASSSKNQKLKLKSQRYNSKFKIFENLQEAIEESLKNLSKDQTLYILPTYSAMLEIRRILTGKKIL